MQQTAVAAADDDTGAGTSGAGFWIQKVHQDQGGHGSSGGDVGGAGPKSQPVLIGNGACDAADQVAGEFLNAGFCNTEDQQPVLTLADVQKAFAELKLDPGTLVVQPPDGLTLVNFKTNFYTTTTTPTTLTVTLLDQPVTLEATPATYTWHFGDGQTTSTTEPGAAYPALTITHEYLRKGDYRPSLSTTYTGRYKVADGPWQTIPGTVTIDGPGQPLRAIEAKPKLVGY
ncbi:hypothetical protein FBY23_3376 [Nocardioides sp. SLBN-35]|nr:hypothetical protein FBY23_3376 [Nocardioides sp. SLBN-35]